MLTDKIERLKDCYDCNETLRNKSNFAIKLSINSWYGLNKCIKENRNTELIG